jgi:hypothetical protein
MTAESGRGWGVLGAIHLDFTCKLPEMLLAATVETQTWVDWKVSSGGVAGNIAQHLDEVGLQSIFFALAGSGTLADYAASLAARDLTNCELILLPGEEDVGLVCLINATGAETRRLVIGPQRSQVDVTRYADIRNRMLPYLPQVNGIFIDGYLLRGRVAEWLADIEAMADDQWKLHLELVPHDIWTEFSFGDLNRLRRACFSISSSLTTVERIIGQDHPALAPPIERARNTARQLGKVNGKGAGLHLRWGGKNQSELCLMQSNDGSCVVWKYFPESRAVPRSAQDRLYVREVSKTIPGHWRTEVGRFVISEP